ncbi:hypothetical protein RBSWK_00729 [Rhodopirellula baltica SWK14]|uniref:Uncharacterized protein n=1 Tax=Rhodopirellula baltica SWK14 TaxID=993516 RepID=L7CM06_RHOBT|nr:hypothetical protein RBSWK_00729 [Rhodopirellula baltica SWK14]
MPNRCDRVFEIRYAEVQLRISLGSPAQETTNRPHYWVTVVRIKKQRGTQVVANSFGGLHKFAFDGSPVCSKVDKGLIQNRIVNHPRGVCPMCPDKHGAKHLMAIFPSAFVVETLA